jgi:uncharacterized membrane protein
MALFLRPAISRAERRRLVAAIGRAEAGHRGEIQVYVEERYHGDGPLRRAAALFEELGLDQTTDGTGVLLYVAVADRRAAVWAGPGIYGAASPDFWKEATDEVAAGFARGRAADGIERALAAIGQLLLIAVGGEDRHANELPNRVIVR